MIKMLGFGGEFEATERNISKVVVARVFYVALCIVFQALRYLTSGILRWF